MLALYKTESPLEKHGTSLTEDPRNYSDPVDASKTRVLIVVRHDYDLPKHREYGSGD